jgi:hypothetical protein
MSVERILSQWFPFCISLSVAGAGGRRQPPTGLALSNEGDTLKQDWLADIATTDNETEGEANQMKMEKRTIHYGLVRHEDGEHRIVWGKK